MERITRAREASQPIREKTGGSTFKNPPGMKAWELIDKAGCRGLSLGGASVDHALQLSHQSGAATAADLEALGEVAGAGFSKRAALRSNGKSSAWASLRGAPQSVGAGLRPKWDSNRF